MYTLRIATRDSKLIIRKTTAKIKVGASVKREIKVGASIKRGLKGDTGEQGPQGPSGVVESIQAGANITVDSSDPANPVVSSSGGAGTVAGPATSTDNAIARYDGTTGKLLKDSEVLIDDQGRITSTAELFVGDNTSTLVDGSGTESVGSGLYYANLASMKNHVKTSGYEADLVTQGFYRGGSNARGVFTNVILPEDATAVPGSTTGNNVDITYAAPFTMGTMQGYRSTLRIENPDSTVNNAYGYAVSPNFRFGTLGTFYGYYVSNLSGATKPNTAYGAYIGNMGNASTTAYGLYIASQTGAGTKYSIYSAGGDSYFAGRIGIGTTTPSTPLDINSDKLRLRTPKTPASSTATGDQGEIAWDSDYIYVCTDTDTWKRTPLASW